jgi:hypothetical protein
MFQLQLILQPLILFLPVAEELLEEVEDYSERCEMDFLMEISLPYEELFSL